MVKGKELGGIVGAKRRRSEGEVLFSAMRGMVLL